MSPLLLLTFTAMHLVAAMPLPTGEGSECEADECAATAKSFIQKNRRAYQAPAAAAPPQYEALTNGTNGCDPGFEITSEAECVNAIEVLRVAGELNVKPKGEINVHQYTYPTTTIELYKVPNGCTANEIGTLKVTVGIDPNDPTSYVPDGNALYVDPSRNTIPSTGRRDLRPVCHRKKCGVGYKGQPTGKWQADTCWQVQCSSAAHLTGADGACQCKTGFTGGAWKPGEQAWADCVPVCGRNSRRVGDTCKCSLYDKSTNRYTAYYANSWTPNSPTNADSPQLTPEGWEDCVAAPYEVLGYGELCNDEKTVNILYCEEAIKMMGFARVGTQSPRWDKREEDGNTDIPSHCSVRPGTNEEEDTMYYRKVLQTETKARRDLRPVCWKVPKSSRQVAD